MHDTIKKKDNTNKERKTLIIIRNSKKKRLKQRVPKTKTDILITTDKVFRLSKLKKFRLK